MPVSSSTEHWIKPDALTINLNHFGDPDYLQVSVLAGAVVMAFKQDVIGYNAAHNYRTWPLEAANTYLETSSAYNVYARLTRSEVNARALIIYDTVLRDMEGREITYAEDGSEVLGNADADYFFVFLGQISRSVDSNGQSIHRDWLIEFRFGSLDTSQYRNEESGGEWQKMFRLNKVTDMIDVLRTFSSATFKKFYIGEKVVSDIKRSTDSDKDVPVGDENLATSGYVDSEIEKLDDRFLSKIKDDETPHNLGIGGNVSVGGDIVSNAFAEDTEHGGYAIRQTNDGAYEAEVDNIVARILAKTYDLLVQNHATFVGDLTSEEFISGFLGGKGWSIRMREGKSVAELDELIVRGSMRVYEFIISQLLGENDNRIFTGMMEVDHYDAETGKIYLKTDNGKLYNPFRVDDVVIVQQYGEPNEDNGFYVIKQYELIVTEAQVGNKSNGESRLDWITFRDFTTTIEGGNESLIAERDTLVRVDNLTNQDRKGIIQMMAAGKDTPYMDFIYGYKTDPDNSLKGRLGNLGGVWNELFGKGGWLRGFGAYLTNLYAVGEFVIAHTGENVSDTIEIAKGQFRTNFRQTTYDLSEEDNFFTNAALTNNCEHWILGSADGTEYFMVDGLPQFFNFDVYATEDSYAGLVEWKGRDMLRLNKSAVRQLNPLIRKAGTHKVYKDSVMNEDGTFTDSYDEVPDTLYLSVRLYVAGTGNVEIGFVGDDGAFIDNDFHVSKEYASKEDGYEIKIAGVWDNTGDFCIISTGDVYVDMLSLTDKPLENFKTETWSAIEQNSEKIRLTAGRIQASGGSLADLEVKYNQIVGQVSSLTDEFGVTQKELEDFQTEAEKEFDELTQNILGIDEWKSELEEAGLNSTMIKQTDDTISIVSGAFEKDENGTYQLKSAAGSLVYADLEKAMNEQFATLDGIYAKIGTYVEYDPETGEITSEVKLSADNIKLEANDLITLINNEGTIALKGKNINLDGAFTANELFNIDEDGYMSCSGGRIGDFVIFNGSLENFTDRASISIKDHQLTVPQQIIEIGLSTTADEFGLGYATGVGMFRNDVEGSLNNVSLIVSAKGATDNNIALYMAGGCIAGLAEKVGYYSNNQVVSRLDTIVITNGYNVTLPVMNHSDNGHKITVISNYLAEGNISCQDDNFFDLGGVMQTAAKIDKRGVAQFVFISNFEHQFPIDGDKVRRGCWVKI